MGDLGHLISHYGYPAIAAVIGLESMGVPLPGETMLVLSAVYAATHSNLNIVGVIGAAALGAIVGDNIGYWVGREFGYPLLVRFGRYVGLTEARIKLGQYLFLRHGGKVVFFGRFFAVLRVLAAFLAGVNRMEWKTFLVANAAGGVLWSLVYGVGAYIFGAALLHTARPVTIALVIIGLIIVVVATWYVRSHEAELERRAEVALPGPLRPVDWRRRRPRS
jgi:membrane protein DedA with SNARE-associated domain